MPILTEHWIKLKSRAIISLQCDYCNKVYCKTKNRIQDKIAKNKEEQFFCSFDCAMLYRRTGAEISCRACGKLFYSSLSLTVGNRFCSQTCSATYNNGHKTFGYRRSKLERYIEENIRIYYPSLEMICNGVSLISSELDFYFPRLRLAIELNGIVHYEPIYGKDKLERIKSNDSGKAAKCRNVGVELAIIDVSGCKRYEKQKDIYWNIVKDLILSVSRRLADA